MRRTRIRYCETAKEFNKVLSDAKHCTDIVEGDYFQLKKNDPLGISLTCNSYIKIGQVNVEITTAYSKFENKNEEPCTYVFRLDGETKEITRGSDCFMLSQRFYKVPDLRENEEMRNLLDYDEMRMKFNASCGPLVGFNPKFDKTEHNVWIYDLNSAYAVQLMKQLPDTSHYEKYAVVGKNQVGFDIDNNEIKMFKQEGLTCQFVFDLMDSPLKHFARKYYDIKRSAPKGSLEREKAKAILNLTVGMWQKYNPFLRAYVVLSCNEYIESLLDENSTMWNTDAIYSTVERPDLEIGTDVGQWKLEYKGLFRQVGCNYQKVGTHETSYRHVPKTWFKKNWNILTDELPTETSNIYYIDKADWKAKRR